MKNALKDEPLKVIILGRPKSGKSTLALLLMQFLQDQGIDVQLIPDEWEPPHRYQEIMQSLSARVTGMHEKKVYIEMVQARKNTVFDKPSVYAPTSQHLVI